MSKKDLKHGEGNRCAPGQKVFDPADSSHISTSSPIQLKRKQLEEDPQYQDGAINRAREKSTSKKRAAKEVKPI
ncbi:MAG TPA: hypothetical protein VGR55_00490 [Candidatus Acidoferrum sp.]|nr:hypothetical protein [Candidatus Acidoferrum sp.]